MKFQGGADTGIFTDGQGNYRAAWDGEEISVPEFHRRVDLLRKGGQDNMRQLVERTRERDAALLQVDAIKRLVENSQWHAGGYRLISDEQFEAIFAEKIFRGCNMGCDLAHHRDCSWWEMKPIEKRKDDPGPLDGDSLEQITKD